MKSRDEIKIQMLNKLAMVASMALAFSMAAAAQNSDTQKSAEAAKQCVIVVSLEDRKSASRFYR